MSSDTAPDRWRAPRERSVRETVLNIALGLYADGAWDRTSMERIAGAAFVSRQTLYNTFGDRNGITQALLSRETDRLLYGVGLRWHHALRQGAASSGCLVAAMSWVLAVSRGHPLLHPLLTGQGYEPSCTGLLAPQGAAAGQQADHGRPPGAVGAVTDLCRRLDAAEVGATPDRFRGVDAVVRMTVSYLLVPTATSQARAQIAYAARSLLPDGQSPGRSPGSCAAGRDAEEIKRRAVGTGTPVSSTGAVRWRSPSAGHAPAGIAPDFARLPTEAP